MEFSLGSLMSDLGIDAQVDCVLENERRFYKGDYKLQDPENINEINSAYSKEVGDASMNYYSYYYQYYYATTTNNLLQLPLLLYYNYISATNCHTCI